MIAIAQADAATEAQTAKQLFQQGKVEESIAHFQRAVELRGKDPTGWYNLAFANRKAGHFAEAARAYARYVQLAPDDPDGYFGLAESLRQSGRGAEARQAYEAYLAKENRPSEERWKAVARQRVAELGNETGQSQLPPPAQTPPAAPPQASKDSAAATPAPSADASRAATPVAPAAPVDRSPPGTPGARAPDVAPAPASAASRATSAPRPDPAALTKQGDAALSARDLHSALYAYQDAAMADPRYVPARVKLGHVYLQMGHPAEAAEQWNKALQLEPQNGDARAALSALRQKMGATAEAAVPSSGLAPSSRPQKDEPSAKAHYAKGVALVNDRKYQEALPELDQAIAQKPRYAVALVARGSARIALAQYEAAIADYSAAREADPSLAAPLFGLAEAFRATGQAEKAADFYRQYAASAAADAQPQLKHYAIDTAQALAPR